MLALLLATLVRGGPDDTRLVRRALAGHRGAMRELVGRLLPVLRARVRRRLGPDHPEQEDVVQEIWLRLVSDDGKVLRRYDPRAGTTLEGYAGLVAERQAVSWLRKHTAQRRGGHLRAVDDAILDRRPAPNGDPAAAAEAHQLADALGAHLWAHLPEIGRLVLRLTYTDDHPPATAAAQLGVNTQVVYNWQHKIRALVRAFLAAQRAAG